MVEFVPQEGVIEVTAGGVEAAGGQPGGGLDPQGKPDVDRDGDAGGVVVKQDVSVRVTVQPPAGTGPSKSKVFRIRDVLADDPVDPLQLGVRPEQAGKTWRCVSATSAGRRRRSSARCRSSRSAGRRNRRPPRCPSTRTPASPVHFLRPGDTAALRFEPAAGLIEVLAFGFQTEFDDVVGKPGRLREDDIGLKIHQDVRMRVELRSPSGATVGAADFRSQKVLAESPTSLAP